MKLRSISVNDIQVLLVSGSVSFGEVKVLKAGITKLFKTGKNKIILEFSDLHSLSGEILRELSLLDVLARELSGKIVIAGINLETKKKIELFASPPVISSFEKREDAIDYFTGKTQLPVQIQAAPEGEIAQKQTLRKHELTDIGILRKKIVQLENENKTLRSQLQNLIIQRRIPAGISSYELKIRSLQEQLLAALTKTPPGLNSDEISRK